MANSFIFGGMPVSLGELVTMEYSHHEIHEGSMFMTHYYGGTLAAAGTLMMTIAAGTIAPHLMTDIAVGGDARVRITEGGTLTGGTAVSVYNMNRNNSGSCLSTIKHSGTLTGGTVINDFHIAGGSGPQATGGAARANHEIMTRTSKNTTIEIINLTTAYPASIGAVWYEDNEE
jgi:hypothetical protein